MLDQHNGTGAIVNNVVWFNDNTGVYVIVTGAPINFTVNIYGEPLPPPSNDLILGTLTENSVLLHT